MPSCARVAAGTLAWIMGMSAAALVNPAIGLARDGFVVDEYRSASIRSDSTRLASRDHRQAR